MRLPTLKEYVKERIRIAVQRELIGSIATGLQVFLAENEVKLKVAVVRLIGQNIEHQSL